MASNEIHIKVKVDDKGNLSMVGKQADKAAKGMDDLGKSARNTDRNLKGAARTSSNTTKNFSKMAQGTGGLVGAYATLAANVFAVSAAFQFLKQAGDLAQLQNSQLQYSYKTGQSMTLLTKRLQDATGGLLTFQDAAQAGAIGRAAGLSSQQLEGLARVAKNASITLGRDLTDSFNRLTRGAIKAEPELLDELGIIVRLDKAAEDYAAVLNKDVKALTTFEKSQAVVNAVLEQGAEKFDDMGDNVNQIALLGKAFDDLVIKIKNAIEPIASFIAGSLANNIEALAAAFGLLGISIARSLVPAGPALLNMADAAEQARGRLRAGAGSSTLGQNIEAGQFGKREIAAMQRATQSASSQVMDFSKISRAQIQKDLLIIQADTARTMAVNSTFVQRYYLNSVAYFRAMQAEHGKVMGAMKAGMHGLARVASRVLSVVSILGVITLAISLLKDLINLQKSVELKNLQKNAKALTDSLTASNKILADLQKKMDRSAIAMESVKQSANFLDQLRFDGITDAIARLEVETTKTRQGGGSVRLKMTDEIRALGPVALEGAKQLSMMTKELEATGRFAEDDKFKALKLDVQALEEAAKRLNDRIESGKPPYGGMRRDIELLTGSYKGAEKTAREFAQATILEGKALTALGMLREGFEKFRQGLELSTTRYRQFIKFIDDGVGALNQIAQVDGFAKGLVGTLFKAGTNELLFLKKILHDTNLEEITLKQAIDKLNERKNRILRIEKNLEMGKLKIQAKSYAIQIKTTPLMREHLSLENALEQQELKRDNLLEEINFKREAGIILSQDQLDKEIAQLEVEEMRLALIEQQVAESGNLVVGMERAIRDSFESGLQGQIARLLKGEESSVKDAIQLLARGVFEALADEIARQLAMTVATPILNLFGFESSEQAAERRHEEIKNKIASQITALENNTKALGSPPPTASNSPEVTALTNVQSAVVDVGKKLTDPNTDKAGFKVVEHNRPVVVTIADPEIPGATTGRRTPYHVANAEIPSSILDTASIPTPTINKVAADIPSELQRKDIRVTDEEAKQNFQNLDGTVQAILSKMPGASDGEVIGGRSNNARVLNKITDKQAANNTEHVQGQADGQDEHVSGLSRVFSKANIDIGDTITSALSSMVGGGGGSGGSYAQTFIMAAANAMGSQLMSGFARYGGTFKNGKKTYATGGIARGPDSGYAATLHGTEAVIPMMNGRSIPVDLKGGAGGQINNIVVNVASDGSMTTGTGAGEEGENMGRLIAKAVQTELQTQKRSGGILNPYGVA